MYFCNRTCVTVYLMDNARECTECKVRIRPDLLGNRARRTGSGKAISHFCSVDCITQYNLNSKCDFDDTAIGSFLDSGSFQDTWNDIFKNGECKHLGIQYVGDGMWDKVFSAIFANMFRRIFKLNIFSSIYRLIEIILIFSYRFGARCAVRHVPKILRLRLRRSDHHPSKWHHDFLLLECMHDGRLRFLQRSETDVGHVRDTQCR